MVVHCDDSQQELSLGRSPRDGGRNQGVQASLGKICFEASQARPESQVESLFNEDCICCNSWSESLNQIGRLPGQIPALAFVIETFDSPGD